jgi:hypothetical protein
MPYRVAREPYLRIAKRNLAMAQLLHLRGFYEGSVFHACHVFECVISAGIASQNRPIPFGYDRRARKTAHAKKIHDFQTYCGAKIAGTQLQTEFASLSVLLASLTPTGRAEQVRNHALYWMNGIEPQNRFGRRDAVLLTLRVRRFLHEAQRILPVITV